MTQEIVILLIVLLVAFTFAIYLLMIDNARTKSAKQNFETQQRSAKQHTSPIKAAPLAFAGNLSVDKMDQGNISAIPQDSALKRHFLTNLRSNIEAEFGERPTDSSLKRHFDTMVNAKFDACVEELSGKVA